MPKHWAKIFRDATSSERLTALLAKNGFAEALYWRLKAMADDYGRYIGDAADVATGICPRNIIRGHFRLKKVSQALADMEECGLIRFYRVDGKHYLEIIDYLNHAHDQWTSVGKPEYPAPPGWVPPAELIQWLLEHSKNPKATNAFPERFGITEDHWPPHLPYPWTTDTIPTPIPSPIPTPIPSPIPIPLPTPGVGGTDVDVDVDVDSDIDSDKEGDSRVCAREDGPPGDPLAGDEAGNPGDYTHMLICNSPLAAALIADLKPAIGIEPAKAYAGKVISSLKVSNPGITDVEIIAAIKDGKGPRAGKEQTFPSNFIDRLVRDKARASPAKPRPSSSGDSQEDFAADVAAKERQADATG